jgi:putative transposase
MVRVPQNRAISDLVFFITTGINNRIPLFKKPEAAKLVIDSFQFFRQRGEIELYGFVVMPDHLHIVLKVKEPLTISQFTKRLKNYIANSLGEGPIWEKGYWSEVIAGEFFLRQKLVYIHANPVRAGLVESVEEYPWSSAREYYRDNPSVIIDPC